MGQQSGGQLRPAIHVTKRRRSKVLFGCLMPSGTREYIQIWFFLLLPLQIGVKLVTEGMDAAPVRVPVEGVRGSV